MRPLTVDGLNPALLKVQYAVRGELAIKAEILREKLKESNNGLPFDKVISSNIGNPQQKGLDQPPITFTRQVSKRNNHPWYFERAVRNLIDIFWIISRSLLSWSGRN